MLIKTYGLGSSRLIGKRRAFCNGHQEIEATCKQGKHIPQANQAQALASAKPEFERWTKFSREPCRHFIDRLIDMWAIWPTPRTQFRMRSQPLSSIWINSRGRRKCRRGSPPL